MPTPATAPASASAIVSSAIPGRPAAGGSKPNPTAKAGNRPTPADATRANDANTESGTETQSESTSGLFAAIIQSLTTVPEPKAPVDANALPDPPKPGSAKAAPSLGHRLKGFGAFVKDLNGAAKTDSGLPGSQNANTESDTATGTGKKNSALPVVRMSLQKETLPFTAVVAPASPVTKPALITFTPGRESGGLHKSSALLTRPQQPAPPNEVLSADSILQINIRRVPDEPAPPTTVPAELKPDHKPTSVEAQKSSKVPADKPLPAGVITESEDSAPKPAARSGGFAVAALTGPGNPGPGNKVSEIGTQASSVQTAPPQITTTRGAENSALPAPTSGLAPENRPKSEVRPSIATSHASAPETDLPRNDAAQPLRSLALEFTPDGAGDLRLRLSERGGEVHVSLHSSDPSWSGRLHEGIHELVGSLANAGYDADAWTPSQGRQQQHRQPDDNSGNRKQNGMGGETGQFAGLFQQSSEEIQ